MTVTGTTSKKITATAVNDDLVRRLVCTMVKLEQNGKEDAGMTLLKFLLVLNGK